MGELLDAVTIAHGGLDRWNAVRSVDVTFNFSGGLLDLKGFPGHHRPTASVDVEQPRVVMQRLGGDPDDRWIFTRDRVWIERRDGWSVEERSDPAPLLPATFGRRSRRWKTRRACVCCTVQLGG